MSLSAERIALANRAIMSTFDRCSVVWQSIPHWDVGDAGQINVRSDTAFTFAGMAAGQPIPPPLQPGPLGWGKAIPLVNNAVQFTMTLAQACAPTPDALLAAVVPRATQLARQFDNAVIPTLAVPAAGAAGVAAAAAAGVPAAYYPPLPAPIPIPVPSNAPGILAALVLGRQVLEDGGYTAPSCLLAATNYFVNLAQWVGSNVSTEGLLVGANANSLLRASSLNTTVVAPVLPHRMLMIGRRQDVPHGGAATASAGEEAIDIAVGVPPSLEVIGDDAVGMVELAVRIRYATRFKDERAVVVFHDP